MTEENKAVIKVLVKGANLADKVAFVLAISEIGVLPTQSPRKDNLRIDFGRFTYDAQDPNSVLYLFINLTNDKLFDLLFPHNAEGALGCIWVIDSNTPETFPSLRHELIELNLDSFYPFVFSVVAVPVRDSADAWDIPSMSHILGLDSLEIPVIPCEIQDKKSVANVLIKLCEEYINYAHEINHQDSEIQPKTIPVRDNPKPQAKPTLPHWRFK
jgi:signal recognition particle receptor subunit beta